MGRNASASLAIKLKPSLAFEHATYSVEVHIARLILRGDTQAILGATGNAGEHADCASARDDEWRRRE